jgi:hypothetical protein
MTQEQAKEEAVEIFNKMYKYSFCPEYADERDLELEKGVFTKEGEWEDYCAKQCALICINEMLNISDDSNEQRDLEQVKQEIEKI